MTFVEFDGKPPEAPVEDEILTLGGLRDRYQHARRNGSHEPSRIQGIELYFKHLSGVLSEKLPMQGLTLADRRNYVDRRSKKDGFRGKLWPATIKKEIVTLRTAWNWGVLGDLLTGRFPTKGLRYPKSEEKPPFQTWEEFERRINVGALPRGQTVLIREKEQAKGRTTIRRVALTPILAVVLK